MNTQSNVRCEIQSNAQLNVQLSNVQLDVKFQRAMEQSIAIELVVEFDVQLHVQLEIQLYIHDQTLDMLRYISFRTIEALQRVNSAWWRARWHATRRATLTKAKPSAPSLARSSCGRRHQATPRSAVGRSPHGRHAPAHNRRAAGARTTHPALPHTLRSARRAAAARLAGKVGQVARGEVVSAEADRQRDAPERPPARERRVRNGERPVARSSAGVRGIA